MRRSFPSQGNINIKSGREACGRGAGVGFYKTLRGGTIYNHSSCELHQP